MLRVPISVTVIINNKTSANPMAMRVPIFMFESILFSKFECQGRGNIQISVVFTSAARQSLGHRLPHSAVSQKRHCLRV
jgi:hypothetical protein